MKKVLRELFSTGLYLLVVLLLTSLVIRYIGQRTMVEGISMEPTLYDGDNLILDKVIPRDLILWFFPSNIRKKPIISSVLSVCPVKQSRLMNMDVFISMVRFYRRATERRSFLPTESVLLMNLLFWGRMNIL